jgi:AcrR family transcriptional regulator
VPTDTPTTGRGAGLSRPDGRRVRGERNKEAVVEALLSLYEAGDVEPSMARVAELAGVSERSVFRYFEDKDDLIESAIALQTERVGHLFEGLSIDGSFEKRLDAILDHRLRLFDAVSGVMRASEFHEHRSSLVRDGIDKRRAVLRAQAVDQFRPELNRLDDQQTASRAIDVALGLETIAYLARHYKRSQLRDTLAFMVRSALKLR